MQEVQSTRVGSTISIKKGSWEVVLTDPSLNKFSFGRHISNKYVTTDIISPLGETSILYNTISEKMGEEVVIPLNFAEIDQTQISSIKLSASSTFFKHWKVSLRDNRTKREILVRTESRFPINPVIELNKLMKMGFTKNTVIKGTPYFEVLLSRISN